MENKRRLQELAGILKESEEKEEIVQDDFTVIEFENDLKINSDNEDLFRELEDQQEDSSKN